MMGEKKNEMEIAILKCASKLAKSKITARKKQIKFIKDNFKIPQGMIKQTITIQALSNILDALYDRIIVTANAKMAKDAQKKKRDEDIVNFDFNEMQKTIRRIRNENTNVSFDFNDIQKKIRKNRNDQIVHFNFDEMQGKIKGRDITELREQKRQQDKLKNEQIVGVDMDEMQQMLQNEIERIVKEGMKQQEQFQKAVLKTKDVLKPHKKDKAKDEQALLEYGIPQHDLYYDQLYNLQKYYKQYPNQQLDFNKLEYNMEDIGTMNNVLNSENQALITQMFNQLVNDKLPNYSEQKGYDNYWLCEITYEEFRDGQYVNTCIKLVPINSGSKEELKKTLYGLIAKNKVISDQYDDFDGFQIVTNIKFIPVSQYANTLVQNTGQLVYKKHQGSYFNFLCTIPCLRYVLQRYQIGTIDMREEELDQLNEMDCFPFALMQILPQNEFIQIYDKIIDSQQLFKDNLKKLGLKRPLVIHQIQGGQVKYHRLEPCDSKFEYSTCYTPYDINICYHMDHYFIVTFSGVSEAWINNYEKVMQLFQQGQISQQQYQQYLTTFNLTNIKYTKGKYYFYYKNTLEQTLLSYNLINILMRKGYFQQIKNTDTVKVDKKVIQYYPQITNLNNNSIYSVQQDQQIKYKQTQQYYDIIDADFEAFTKDSQGNNIKHKPYLVCAVSTSNNQYFIQQEGLIEKLLEDIENRYQVQGQHFLLRFYNLSYDRCFMFNHKLQIRNLINNGTKTICFDIYTGRNHFHVIDNLLLFNYEKLANLPKIFFTEEEREWIHKEYMPYEYYTEERYNNVVGNIDEALKYIQPAISKQEFLDSIKKAGAYINDNEFNMKQYAIYYCCQDVQIQRLANIKLNKLMYFQLGLYSHNYISISSLSQDYFKKERCFEGCYKSSGLIRSYLEQFQVGGRCMVANNAKYETNTKIQDLDACSLYPSAMSRCYFPTGVPYKMTPEMIQWYNVKQNLFNIREDQTGDQITLFMTVRLFKGQNFINRVFPLIDNKGQDSEFREFTNEQEGIHFLSHVRLQDAIRYQNYDYQIIDGIYFTGRNYRINEVIRNVYDNRKYYKSKGMESLANIYKLVMNSLYGKTIERTHDKQDIILKTRYGITDYKYDLKILQKLMRNWEQITNIETFDDGQCVSLQTRKQIKDDKYNFNQCGIMILDYSKRIMNEVICLAEDLQIKMFYQDTDSIHIESDKVQLLQSEYKRIYNRDLIGENLGQFHNDFKSRTGQQVLYSDYSIFNGKKCYLDRMVLEDGSYEYKICMKGIPEICIMNHPLGIEGVYKALFENKPINFDIAQYKKSFLFNKGDKYSVITNDQFLRTITMQAQPKDENQMYQF